MQKTTALLIVNSVPPKLDQISNRLLKFNSASDNEHCLKRARFRSSGCTSHQARHCIQD